LTMVIMYLEGGEIKANKKSPVQGVIVQNLNRITLVSNFKGKHGGGGRNLDLNRRLGEHPFSGTHPSGTFAGDGHVRGGWKPNQGEGN